MAKKSNKETITVGEASKRLNVHPRRISAVLADTDPHAKVFAIRGHRRQIPVDALGTLKDELAGRGLLSAPPTFQV